jgi:hypothetical protein
MPDQRFYVAVRRSSLGFCQIGPRTLPLPAFLAATKDRISLSAYFVRVMSAGKRRESAVPHYLRSNTLTCLGLVLLQQANIGVAMHINETRCQYQPFTINHLIVAVDRIRLDSFDAAVFYQHGPLDWVRAATVINQCVGKLKHVQIVPAVVTVLHWISS